MKEEIPLISTSLNALPKIAEGKVRDLYEVDSKTLLFVATDRISAYDVIMENVGFRYPSIIPQIDIRIGHSLKRQTPNPPLRILVLAPPNLHPQPANALPNSLPPRLYPRFSNVSPQIPLHASPPTQDLPN